tara:strand:- start:746 stop:1051 length:306 start_codon:yes stop_codon:yes gene_type:complete
MNNWETIIKARVRPIRELDPERRNRSPERRKPPVKIAGGKPSPSMGRTDDLDSVFEEDMSNLAEMTRSDLIDKAVDYIKSLSKEQIISILERTQGTLEEKI